MKQRAIAIGIFWAFLLTLLAFRAPGFFEPANIRDMAVTNAPALIVAIGMTLVIVAGEIDVSVASQFAVLSVIAGTLAKAGLRTASQCCAMARQLRRAMPRGPMRRL